MPLTERLPKAHTMRRHGAGLVTGASLITLLLLACLQLSLMSPANAEPANPKLSNKRCLMCHGRTNFSREQENGEVRDLHIDKQRFANSVHGVRNCVNCHKDIIKIPHRKGIDRKVGCVECHERLWEKAKEEGTMDQTPLLGVVIKQINSYMGSIHARPSMADQSRTNATCYDCHDAHYITPIDSKVGAKGREEIPQICGKCHQDKLRIYKTSIHGQEVAKGNTNAAVCSDCHTTHNIENPHDSSIRVAITQQCGNCHEEKLKSYVETYHGKVTSLGYGSTAKCFDCHGSHDIRPVSDPASSMNIKNRLNTCRNCHTNATKGFTTFQPHGTTHDLKHYPVMWFASKFMGGLLLGTFAFFWLHSALWYYREYQDRKRGKDRPHIMLNELPPELEGRTELEGKTYVMRFGRWWRLAHLVGALSIMTLALTGLTVLYADSSWAHVVIKLLGGPKSAGIIHRIGAIGFISVFFIHLVYFGFRIGGHLRTFKWFGPNSLVPNWQDLKDIGAMFRWFLGLASRPRFEHFTYWEKFDYWAPFWGMMIIGISGMMMWFPEFTASILPGWVFNVASIVHGEEAILAVVFLFTVHFFNNHFRPDKFPLDITMFTGKVPLEEYRHEHRREYDRLVASGELEKYLVHAPSAPMKRGSKILGAVLIVIGLTLLAFVILGVLNV